VRWSRLIVVCAISTGCGGEQRGEAPAQTSTDEGPIVEPGPVCASLGLDDDAAVLVANNAERVVIVRADGSTLDLDAHPRAAPFGQRYAEFGVSAAGIVTTSRSYGEPDVFAASMFDLDGTSRWSMQWEGVDNVGRPMVSATGDVALVVEQGTILVRGDDVRTYEGLGMFTAPQGGVVAASIVEGDVVRVGWFDLDAETFTEVSMLGDVEAHEGRLVSHYAGVGQRVQISAPGEALREVRVDADRTLDHRRLAGSRMMLTDGPVPEVAAHIDLDAGTVSIAPLDPPDGFHTLDCGWISLMESGDALIPISDGNAISLYRMTPDGEWSPTPTMPVSGVPGAYGRLVEGTYWFGSITNSNCGDSLPEQDGTVVGESLQLVRPESGVSFVREDIVVNSFVTTTKDGRCAAWRTAPDRLLFIDMVTGDEQEIEVPEDDGHNGGYAFVDGA
jgi:hypothetical protein